MAKKKVAKKSSKKTIKKVAKKSAPVKAPKKPVKAPPKAAMKKATKKAIKRSPAPVKKAVAKSVVKKPAKKVVKKGPSVSKKTLPVKPAPVTPPISIPPGSTREAPTPKSKVPAVGRMAPAFTLPSSAGGKVSLADYAGKTVVLYFYPKADTPGCTVQACAFRDSIVDYGKAGLNVIGISPDPVDAVTDFATKFNVNFPLLADADHRVCDAYGVWVEKSMYGKTYMGASRTTFIIRDGKISHVFEKVNPQGHEKAILEAVEGPH